MLNTDYGTMGTQNWDIKDSQLGFIPDIDCQDLQIILDLQENQGTDGFEKKT